MATAAKPDDARSLRQLLTSTQALLTQLTSSLEPSAIDDKAEGRQPIADPPNPLHVVRDAARLLKAHVTKLSLLAINKPFTPSAIGKILRELSATCLPALAGAGQILQQEDKQWPAFVRREVHARTRRAFRELAALLQEVQSIADGADIDAGGGKRASLHATGIVWEACDALVELDKLGVAGLAVRRAEQYRDTIKDAIEELQEWREGDDLDSETHGDALVDSDDEGVDGEEDSIEDIFHAANSMPRDHPEIREAVEQTEAFLKKAVLLYTALIKRRLKTVPPVQTDAEDEQQGETAIRLDKIMTQLHTLPDATDQLAGAFYDLDENQAKEMLAKCVQHAKAACHAAALDWRQKEDEFTAWAKKWEAAVSS